MQSKELLLMANHTAGALMFPLLEDLRTAPHVTPTDQGGNHAHWILGHLVLAEAGFQGIMHNAPNPKQMLEPFFGRGREPSAEATDYPPYDELLAELKSMHEATLSSLEGMTEADLDQVCQDIPKEIEAFFGTWRQVLLMRPIHWANHRGQLADCRRAAGRPPLML